MKVAITSVGNSPESKLDQRFGRCRFFAFYDTDAGNLEFVANPNAESLDGAGPASVQFVAARSVEKIVSGEFGIKIKSLLESLNIQMIILKDENKTVKEIIDMLNH
jgi:predicted Fe-Mo cluster-binding NifX family protein